MSIIPNFQVSSQNARGLVPLTRDAPPPQGLLPVAEAVRDLVNVTI